MSKIRTVGLITARGGSKGIPRKNVLPLDGKPLIAWTIQTALESRLLEDVIVSTEDSEIASVAQKFGAQVPFLRPAHLAQDDSPHIDVVLHALDWLVKNRDQRPKWVVLLQPTSPFRAAQDIDNAVQLALSQDANAVVSVTETSAHPYLTRTMDRKGRLKHFMKHCLAYPRRQDLPPAYAINGAVYVNKYRSLAASRSFYPKNTYGYVMPPERSLQIDTPWDLFLARLIVKDLGRRTNRS